jgi:hypothetical protein
MKGRYQNPDDGKFNRPDPMRDWDWTSPHTLNLYQYGRNEPINGYDPNGFGWWSKGKAIYKLGKVAWKKGGVPSKADFAMTFKDTVEAFHIVSNPEVPFLTRFGTAFGATADWLAPVGGSEVKSAKKILSGGGKAKDTAKATANGVEAIQESKKIEKVAEKLDKVVPEGSGKATKETDKAFSTEKQALVDMAKKDKKTGMTADDMQAYKDLNKELPDPFPANKVRGPEAHPNRPHGKEPHGHVGPVDHIPIKEK